MGVRPLSRLLCIIAWLTNQMTAGMQVFKAKYNTVQMVAVKQLREGSLFGQDA